ncbi:hypothetical protein BHM03_00062936 [Ensete ventricosum]|nr:hypothetical protein BHM03_00062936 [Ensete ventricosum]
MSRGGEAAAQKERREEGRTRRRRRRRKAAAAAENEEKENKSADRHGWRKRTRASMRAVGDAIDDAGDGGRGSLPLSPVSAAHLLDGGKPFLGRCSVSLTSLLVAAPSVPLPNPHPRSDPLVLVTLRQPVPWRRRGGTVFMFSTISSSVEGCDYNRLRFITVGMFPQDPARPLSFDGDGESELEKGELSYEMDSVLMRGSERVARIPVNVDSFGAVGDGVADDTQVQLQHPVLDIFI